MFLDFCSVYLFIYCLVLFYVYTFITGLYVFYLYFIMNFPFRQLIWVCMGRYQNQILLLLVYCSVHTILYFDSAHSVHTWTNLKSFAYIYIRHYGIAYICYKCV